MNKQVSVLGNLRVAGAVVLDKDEVDFPSNPKPGTLLLKGGDLFAYTLINGILSWYPLFQTTSNAYLHTQVTPNTTWVVNHQLGSEYCWYQIKDNNSNIIYEMSAETNIDGNTTTLTFAEPVSGTAIFIGPNDVVLSNINASLIHVGGVEINTNNITINGVRVLTADSLSAAIDAASTTIETNVITTLRDGVVANGDTLAKLYSLIQAIEVTLQSDDVTLDTIQEVVTRIKSDEGLLASLTTAKVNISDIINNLTSTAIDKPLSAAQGKVLFDAIVVLQNAGSGGNAISSLYANFAGAVTPMIGDQPWYPSKTITFKNVFAYLSSNAVSAVTAAIRVNGVVIQNIAIPVNQKTSSTAVNFSLNATDFLTIDILSGSGNNLTLRLDY